MISSPDEPIVVATDFPVRYAETDAMGVVHHANYLVYFEEGRSHYMREMGIDYAQIEASGYQLPVTEVGIRYIDSLRYGDRVHIRSHIIESRSRRLSFGYEVRNLVDNKVLVTGITSHIWTDANGKITRAPQSWQSMYLTFVGSASGRQ